VTEQTKDQIIADLEARVATLESTLIATNDALTNIQRSIVELTADHVQRVFNDDVLVDSIAHRIMVAGANAIAHKAKASKQRAPELVVVEGYVPGAIRVTLTDNGPLIEEQTEDGQWLSGDAISEEMRQPHVLTVFGDLVVAYGGEIGRAYYVLESTHLEEFRKNTSAQAMEVLGSLEKVADAAHAGPNVSITFAPTSLDGGVSSQTHNETVSADAVFEVVEGDQVRQVMASALKAGMLVNLNANGQVTRQTVIDVIVPANLNI